MRSTLKLFSSALVCMCVYDSTHLAHGLSMVKNSNIAISKEAESQYATITSALGLNSTHKAMLNEIVTKLGDKQTVANVASQLQLMKSSMEKFGKFYDRSSIAQPISAGMGIFSGTGLAGLAIWEMVANNLKLDPTTNKIITITTLITGLLEMGVSIWAITEYYSESNQAVRQHFSEEITMVKAWCENNNNLCFPDRTSCVKLARRVVSDLVDHKFYCETHSHSKSGGLKQQCKESLNELDTKLKTSTQLLAADVCFEFSDASDEDGGFTFLNNTKQYMGWNYTLSKCIDKIDKEYRAAHTACDSKDLAKYKKCFAINVARGSGDDNYSSYEVDYIYRMAKRYSLHGAGKGCSSTNSGGSGIAKIAYLDYKEYL